MKNQTNDMAMLNVLSLEDSVHDFEIIREKLIDAGLNMNFSRVDKEKEFTSMLQLNKYDIVLADFNLPGFHAFKALKLCNEICPEVPFVCVSGAIGEETAIELLKQGAVDYVMKDKLDRLPFVCTRALNEAKEKEELRLVEIELKKSEERFRHISHSISDISYSCLKEKDGRYSIEWMNGAVERITGYSIDEIIAAKCWGQLVIDEDIETFKHHINDLAPGSTGNCELRLRHKNGSIVWVESYADCIRVKDHSGDLYLYGALVNITDRKQAEEALRQKMNELQRFHNLTVGRELAMIELKKEVNQLLIKSGLKEKYRIVE